MDGAFQFDVWHIEPHLNRVVGPEGHVDMEPRLIRILQCLAQHAGEVVSRDDLMAFVWPNVIVSESSLNSSISELRRLLNDDRSGPKYIETIRGRGYRLVAPVRWKAAIEEEGEKRGAEADTFSFPSRTWVLGSLAVGLAAILLIAVLRSSEPAGTPTFGPPQPFTSLLGAELGPVFSPSSEQVAFVLVDQQNGVVDIYVQAHDSNVPRQLTDYEGAELYPSWSPDGQTLAFAWRRPDSYGIYTIPITGGLPTKETDLPETARHVTWSPDGETFIYSASEDGLATTIHAYDRATQTTKRLIAATDSGSDLWPVLSPDGQYLAFQRYASNEIGDVFVMNLREESPPHRLTTHDRPPLGHSWSPDGTEIWYAIEQDRAVEVWSIEPQGSNQRLVQTFPQGEMGNFRLAPNGQTAAWVKWNVDTNMWQLRPTGSEVPSQERLWLNSSDGEQHFHYAPDGLQAVFISNRTGVSELWKADFRTRQVIQLTTLNDITLQRPRWSPTGRLIAFERRTDNQSDVYLVDAEGGIPTPLTSPDSNDEAPTWSWDGQAVYFGSDRSGSWQIWRQNIDGSPPVQITTDGGYRGIEHPGRETLTFVKQDTPFLYDIDLATNRTYQRTDTLYGQTLDNFEVNQDGLYFVNRLGLSPQYAVFHSLDRTAPSNRIAHMPSDLSTGFYNSGLGLAPDGSFVVGVMDRAESDLVLTALSSPPRAPAARESE